MEKNLPSREQTQLFNRIKDSKEKFSKESTRKVWNLHIGMISSYKIITSTTYNKGKNQAYFTKFYVRLLLYSSVTAFNLKAYNQERVCSLH